MAVSEDSLVVSKRGRPRELDGPGSSVHVWMSECHHDRLAQLASLHKMSVSEYARHVLTREIDRRIA
jgi:hypothetical protein